MRHGACVVLAVLLSAQALAADPPKAEDFPEATSVAPFDEFLSKPRHVNLRIDPIAPLLNFDLFFKQFGASLDFALLRNLTLGASVRGGPNFKLGDSYALVHKLGVTAGYSMNGNNLTDSFVVWPSVFFYSLPQNSAAPDDQVLGEMDCREVSVLAGYQWFYQGGWNMNVAVGLKYRYHVQNVTIVNSQGSPTPSDLSTGLSFSAEFMLGWTI